MQANNTRRKQPCLVTGQQCFALLKKHFNPTWLDTLQNLFGVGEDVHDIMKKMEPVIAEMLKECLVWNLLTLESGLQLFIEWLANSQKLDQISKPEAQWVKNQAYAFKQCLTFVRVTSGKATTGIRLPHTMQRLVAIYRSRVIELKNRAKLPLAEGSPRLARSPSSVLRLASSPTDSDHMMASSPGSTTVLDMSDQDRLAIYGSTGTDDPASDAEATAVIDLLSDSEAGHQKEMWDEAGQQLVLVDMNGLSKDDKDNSTPSCADAKTGKRKAKADKPKAKADKPKLKAGKPKSKAGQPKANTGKTKAKACKPKVKSDKPEANAEKPEDQGAHPKAKKPKVKAAQTTVASPQEGCDDVTNIKITLARDKSYVCSIVAGKPKLLVEVSKKMSSELAGVMKIIFVEALRHKAVGHASLKALCLKHRAELMTSA